MTRARIELDFARKPRRITRRGTALLALGLVAMAVVLSQYHDQLTQRSALETRVADLGSTHPTRKPDKSTERVASERRAAFSELTMPWSRLLQELEQASAESDGRVAVLGIEPDRDKRQLRVIAEARTLPVALDYVQRLQTSSALRFPMLESHEVQTRDPEKPVRFQIRADWSTP
jgi:hypothetical protein